MKKITLKKEEVESNEKYDEITKKITKNILKTIVNNDSNLFTMTKKDYIKMSQKRQKEDELRMSLLDFCDDFTLKHIKKCGSISLSIRGSDFVDLIIAEVGFIDEKYSEGILDIVVSGNIISNEPNAIYLYVYIPETFLSSITNAEYEELEMSLIRTIRHELQHCIQFSSMTDRQYNAEIRGSKSMSTEFYNRYETMWKFDEQYFKNKGELEAFTKEIELASKISQKPLSFYVHELLDGRLEFIFQNNYSAYDAKTMVFLCAEKKLTKKEMKQLKEIMNVYKIVSNNIKSFIKKNKNKVCYLWKTTNPISGETKK